MSFIEHTVDGVAYMTAANIGAVHAFSMRLGGVSDGMYRSLNLGIGSGDDFALVRENYEIFCRSLGISIDSLVGTRQVHGSHIRIVTLSDCGKLFTQEPLEADGMITGEPGVALIVFTADCTPILLHDPVCGVIAAVHSGWRGTASDIVGEAVRKMTGEFGCSPVQIKAAIGPCISKCCYETDSDVVEALRKRLDDSVENCLVAREEKYMVDLKEANRLLLTRAGLVDISVSDECTSCLSDKYWSHRRTNGKRGSQAALIMRNAECGIRNKGIDL